MDRSPRLKPPFRSLGFTLLELMVALTIVGILMAIAAPSFREGLMGVRISGQTNDLMSDLALARSESVKRNQAVFLCASNNEATCEGAAWSDGWIVFADANGNNAWDDGELPMKSRGRIEGNNTVASNVGLSIGYRPTGITGIGDATFVICDTRTTPNAGRRIVIGASGRPQVDRVTCPIDP